MNDVRIGPVSIILPGIVKASLYPFGVTIPAIHLFATDIDQHAIEIARAGNYPESILTDR
jgi:two-component system CheB/CheR fusion protein